MKAEEAKLLLRLPLRLHADLKTEARARGITVSALAREILRHGLSKKFREREKA